LTGLRHGGRKRAPAVSGAGAALASAISAGAPQASVTSAGGVITLKGAETQTAKGVKLAAGAYVFRRTAGDGFATFTVNDGAGSPVYVNMLDAFTETFLLIVDGNPVKPGDFAIEIDGTGAWTVTLTKAVGEGAAALPAVLAGAERTTVVSKPFKAVAGTLNISYSYKGEPTGTGTLTICDVATGKALPMTKMMYAGNASGGFTVPVAAAGVYIAQTLFPLKSGGGEVKIAQ
jgi:hypothetical protein